MEEATKNFWKKSKDEHIVYEALSAIADGRVKKVSDRMWQVFSSVGNKYYTILYDSALNAIMSNDNKAYYVGEISYPMVAVFMGSEEISFDKNILENFKQIKWKVINQKNKNDYMKSVEQILQNLSDNGIDVVHIKEEVKKILEQVTSRELSHLGKRILPPSTF